ncbi:MAG: Conserved membrane protein, possible 4-hydroxybenzoate octaprenyltranferase [uncultured Thermomicrobiales bacterium]|uniref:Conserved membrane protein, possible 4-hydroxybenzoate octaprenyltranferase n=1 Tax=uncultured Thermomicrobiales bacterium TaxID=1645740 RepID=A0A6J4UJM9_9BACT|nr:MAG: Conserved membrane protein, possible 4-hydroxybenzoate octaprenyltranferase [uncultured Thermomicrobiales bacterium]
MRPLQWTKNGIVFAALVFDQQLFRVEPTLRSLLAAAVFCAVSSAVYLVNDLRDIEGDRIHPKKRHRPIAAGLVTPAQAGTTAFVLFALALLGAGIVSPGFLAVIVGYVALMVAYSYGLKRLVILDVFAIAAGFVLRAAGGAVAIDVPVSPWLYVCTMLLALFLGFGKRRHELTSLEAAAGRHRANLDAYSVPFLDQLIGIVSSATVMAYAFYTFDAPNVPTNHAMMLTVPFVVYAIFRYLFLIHRRDLGGSPEVLLFADRPLLGAIVAWGLTSIGILYLSGT